MLVLDLRSLFVLPFALAVLFLLWTLWNLIQEGRKKGPAPSRSINLTMPASSSQTATPGSAQIFAFPRSSSAAPGMTHVSQSR